MSTVSNINLNAGILLLIIPNLLGESVSFCLYGKHATGALYMFCALINHLGYLDSSVLSICLCYLVSLKKLGPL